MSFSNVNIGTTAGDHTGDPLRTAFSKINNNFQQIASGQVPITVNAPVNSVAGRTGNIALTIDDIAGGAGINANVTAANLQITNLWANAGAQSSAITTLQGQVYANANVASYLSTQTFYSNTNVEAYFGANVGSLWANAGAQSNSIAGANAAIITANTAMKTYVDNNTSTVTESSTAPSNPKAGALWWDTVSGATFIYYNGAWVDTAVNFVPSMAKSYTVQYLAVGGGGGAGGAVNKTVNTVYINTSGGGGGAGGVLFGSIQLTSGLSYAITVGSGGTGGLGGSNNPGTTGNPSSIVEPTTFANIYAYGGGGGGGINGSSSGTIGASGGGGTTGQPGGSTIQYTIFNYGVPQIVTQGTAGGTGPNYSSSLNQNVTEPGGAGGGLNIPITIGNISATFGTGGSSGTGENGTPNTGNGGNGNVTTTTSIYNTVTTKGGNGGSGVVYITYCSPTQLGTGGNSIWSYTQNGYTYWMHQFTSNGTYVA